MYKCSTCGAEIHRDGDKFVRPCGHENASVIANLSARCPGKGGLKKKK